LDSAEADNAVHDRQLTLAMGDDDKGPSPKPPGHRIKEHACRVVVEPFRGLIQDVDWRVAKQGSRNRDSLNLSGRYFPPRLADYRIQAVRQGSNELGQLRGLEG